MREVTVSKGMLRCGECMEVFDSSKNISTTMQEPFVDIELENKAKFETISEESLKTLSALDDWQNSPADEIDDQINLKKTKPKSKTEQVKTPSEKPKYQSNTFTTRGVEETEEEVKPKLTINWPIVASALLGLLLVLQLAFSYDTLFSKSIQYDTKKIQMLNHNVFAHPIEKNVLLISASIENTAEFNQPFPTLEVRLTNSKAELVALRRFTPDEYLDNYSSDKLLVKNRSTSIKLKIQDPGNQATRFQFDFL